MKNISTKRYRSELEKKIQVYKNNLKSMTKELDSVIEIESLYFKLKQKISDHNDTYGKFDKECLALETMFQDDDLKYKDFEVVVSNSNTPQKIKKESAEVETMSQNNEADGFLLNSKKKKTIYSYLKNKDIEVDVSNYYTSHEGKKSYVDLKIDDLIFIKVPTNTAAKYRKDLKMKIQNYTKSKDKMIQFNSPLNDENINEYYKKENPKRNETSSLQLNNNFQNDLPKALVTINYSNKQNISDFYKTTFTNYDNKMKEHVNNKNSIVIEMYDSIIAALTYDEINVNFREHNRKFFLTNILMMGVKESYQKFGLGRELMKNLNKKTIVTWADKQAVEFFKKIKFKEDSELGELIKTIEKIWDNSVFLTHGLTPSSRFYLIELNKNPHKIAPILNEKYIKKSKNNNIVNDRLYAISSTESENQELKISLIDALKNQDLSFNDDLVYMDDGFKIKMDNVQHLSEENTKLYHKMKLNTNKMIYGPFKIDKKEDIGYCVVATNYIAPYSLICEYSGQVKMYSNSSDNDSLFWLDDKHVIEPITSANLGGFLFNSIK